MYSCERYTSICPLWSRRKLDNCLEYIHFNLRTRIIINLLLFSYLCLAHCLRDSGPRVSNHRETRESGIPQDFGEKESLLDIFICEIKTRLPNKQIRKNTIQHEMRRFLKKVIWFDLYSSRIMDLAIEWQGTRDGFTFLTKQLKWMTDF